MTAIDLQSHLWKQTFILCVGILFNLQFFAGLTENQLRADEPKRLLPIPDKLAVLTFDDSVKSHFTVVRPILLKHGFGATFFVTEGFDFPTNKKDYMTWEEIAKLDSDGFEIGNHTRDHAGVSQKSLAQLNEQLEGINKRCREFGIPVPTSFAYPGNSIEVDALPLLKEAGIRFARRGGAPEYKYDHGRGYAYEPGLDHPLLIPSAGDARPDWTLADFKRAAEQARFGRIAVLQFHGVPDLAHPWVHSPVERFQEYMQFLKDENYTVIALRDLSKYVDPSIIPADPQAAINDRIAARERNIDRDNVRPPTNEADLKNWLENMVWYHRFSIPEIRSATGLSTDEIKQALERFQINDKTRPEITTPKLTVLPYPGGRHPRVGFLEGAIRPQRDTKLSVFLPWDHEAYVVLDVPEAIRRNEERVHGLLYLAHTHVDTMWTLSGLPLAPVEWKRLDDGSWRSERTLPNKVTFGTQLRPYANSIKMKMWITNNSDEPLRDLRVQNCVMLKAAPEFADLTNDNKFAARPYMACRNKTGDRWVITAWANCQNAWGNARCPCMHSDPQFPNCQPGESHTIYGWFSFYEGTDIESELARIEKETTWRSTID